MTVSAFSGMRAAVARDASLYAVDYAAAAKGIEGGRPLELYVDASDYAWAATLALGSMSKNWPNVVPVLVWAEAPTEAATVRATSRTRESVRVMTAAT